MKLRIKERAFTTGMVILATIVVIVLAALQYRWSNQVSEATSIRLADSLQMSMINWHLDFFRNFSEICMAMRVDPEVASRTDWSQYVNRFAEWKKATAHPELVSNIYLLDSDKAADSRAMRLDTAKRGFEPIASPQNFTELRKELREAPPRFERSGQDEWRGRSGQGAQDREFADQLYFRAILWRAGSLSLASPRLSGQFRSIIPPVGTRRIPMPAIWNGSSLC